MLVSVAKPERLVLLNALVSINRHFNQLWAIAFDGLLQLECKVRCTVAALIVETIERGSVLEIQVYRG